MDEPASSPLSVPMETVQLQIRTHMGNSEQMRVALTATVYELKLRISLRKGIKAEKQTLMLGHVELDDNKTLQEQGVVDGSSLILMTRVASGLRQRPRSSSQPEAEARESLSNLSIFMLTTSLPPSLFARRNNRSSTRPVTPAATPRTQTKRKQAQNERTRAKLNKLRGVKSLPTVCSLATTSGQSKPPNATVPSLTQTQPAIQQRTGPATSQSPSQHTPPTVNQQTAQAGSGARLVQSETNIIDYKGSTSDESVTADDDSEQFTTPHESVPSLLAARSRLRERAPQATRPNLGECAEQSCHRRLRQTESTMGRCRCSLVFCTKHRQPDTHNCTHNYRQTQHKHTNTHNKQTQ